MPFPGTVVEVSGYMGDEQGPPAGFVDVGEAQSGVLPALPGAGYPQGVSGRRPPRHAVAATIAMLVFPLTGVLAIAAAFSVDERFYRGDVQGARSRSRWALAWALLSWLFAGLFMAVSVLVVWALVAPLVSQVSSQVSSAVSSVENFSSPDLGLSDLGLSDLGLSDASGSESLGRGGSALRQRQEKVAKEFAVTVRTWEEESGLAPWPLWGEVFASGSVPGVGLVLPFGVLGVELDAQDRQVSVSVLEQSSVCVVLLDASGPRSRVLSVDC